MTQHQETGFHAQETGKRSHARQGTIGLKNTFGMGDMKGVSEGTDLTPHFVWWRRSGSFTHSIWHSYELFMT